MKKPILFSLSLLASSLSFAQLDLGQYSADQCSDTGNGYNQCIIVGQPSSSTGIAGTVGAGNSTTFSNTISYTSGSTGAASPYTGLSTPGGGPAQVTIGNVTANNAAANPGYTYNQNQYMPKKYKVISCDQLQAFYQNPSNGYLLTNNSFTTVNGKNTSVYSLVNPNNPAGSSSGSYVAQNGWAAMEFFDDANKSLGIGGAKISYQEVYFNGRLDHYLGDAQDGTGKYLLGVPNQGWNTIEQTSNCSYSFYYNGNN